MRKYICLSRLCIVICCTALVIPSFFLASQNVSASAENDTGFIIQADKVVGSGMMASLIAQETSAAKAKPMMRITYKSAEIYGMKLSKQLESPNGPITITMQAKGPVYLTNMTVDTDAVSFSGACIHASKEIPAAGMEHVTMAAHFMTADTSILNKLVLQTISGESKLKKPDAVKLLTDLSMLPLNTLQTEIKKISEGHLPLTCDDSQAKTTGKGDLLNNAGNLPGELEDQLDLFKKNPDLVGDIGSTDLNPVKKTVDDLAKPVKDTVDQITKPVKDTVDAITKPVKDTLGNITKPASELAGDVTKPVTDTVDSAAKPLKKAIEPVKGTIKKTAEPVKKITKPVQEALPLACRKLKESNGKMTKELSLDLIDEAIKQKKGLAELCPESKDLEKQLSLFQDNLLESAGLLSILGLNKPADDIDTLKKLKEKISKENDDFFLDLLKE